ncbi:hypothetical protein H0H87_004398, partial [Tephrocybe sp. NHM501043]
TSELLFELYSAPAVTYCNDGLMSFWNNFKPADTTINSGLVVSFNTASTSIIPMIDGRGIMSHAKRFVH